MNTYIIILVAFAFALITNVRCSNSNDPLPIDLKSSILQYIPSHGHIRRVNKHWNKAAKTTQAMASYQHKFDTILTQLLKKTVDKELDRTERKEFASLYAEFVVNGYVHMLFRVPGIIQREIMSQKPNSTLSEAQHSEWLLKKMNNLERNFLPISFQMLQLYIANDPKFEFYLIRHQYSWHKELSSWLKERFRPRPLILWNDISNNYEPHKRSYNDALDWYQKGWMELGLYFAELEPQFNYLQLVWLSDDRIRHVDEGMKHEFINTTREVFGMTVLHYHRAKRFNEIKSLVSKLKQKNRLFLLQKTSFALIMSRSGRWNGAKQLYDRQTWEMVLYSLSPLIKEHLSAEEYDKFVDESYHWQSDEHVHIVSEKDKGYNYKVRSLLTKYKFCDRQPSVN